MKKFLLFAICFLLFLPATARSDENDGSRDLVISDAVGGTADMEEMERKNEMAQDRVEFGLTINGTYYPIPIALEQLIRNGWTISDHTPYFEYPLAGEGYYEARMNLSLSKDGGGIRAGGSIIRLLEKDGVLLEVTIANQADSEGDAQYQKIEYGVVDSILVFYDEKHTSIKLNDKELSSLTQEILQEDYPADDGWIHCPTNYRNHPEFGVSTEYSIEKNLDNCDRIIFVYFDLNDTAFKISVRNQTHLD